ncbi:MAG: nitrogenase component 1, partial [Methanosarcina sp.]
GGRENLKKGLRNVINRYNPKVIGVATTCLAETIGDDVPAIIREFKEEEGIGNNLEKDLIIIPVSTPSYGESHVSGYIKALNAIIRTFAENEKEGEEKNKEENKEENKEKSEEEIVKIPEGKLNKKPDDESSKKPNGNLSLSGNLKRKLNLIPVESLSPADTRELKEILKVTADDYIFLPDISETFDAPLSDKLPKIAPGGTPLSDIKDMKNSLASLGLGTVSKNLAVEYLENSHCVQGHNIPIPIGLSNTDSFFTELGKILSCPIPEKYQKERGRLLDAMVDVHKYLYGVKAAIYGDPDQVLSLTTFLLELGMDPVLVATGSKSPNFRIKVRESFKELRPELKPTILDGIDFDSLNDAVKECRPEILIGNSNGRYIGKALDIPLVRVGLPIHDRVGAQRILTVGYRGALELLDRITNAILEATDTFVAPVEAESAYSKGTKEECIEGAQ